MDVLVVIVMIAVVTVVVVKRTMRQDKTRQDKTRQDKTRQDKTRQESFDSVTLKTPHPPQYLSFLLVPLKPNPVRGTTCVDLCVGGGCGVWIKRYLVGSLRPRHNPTKQEIPIIL